MQPTDKPAIALSPTLVKGVANPNEPQSLVGQVVAERYEILELLGVGGMGSVYRARHVHIKKLVALKTLHPAMLRSAEAVARFEREAVAAARISHPNVAVATDFGHLPDGRYYLVLEYIEGRDLRHELDSKSAFPLSRAVAIGRQIASALAAAHQLGIVHRDLKPENVMLVKRGAEADLVKVLDFGIAKVTFEDGEQPLTQFGAVFGTPQYMSPEQCKGQVVDGRSDLYTLGVMLYEMLTGKPLFDADDALGFIVQHLNTQPAPLPSHLPEPLRALVQTLLEKEPENRPATAADVLLQLDGLIASPEVARLEAQTSTLRKWQTLLKRLGSIVATSSEKLRPILKRRLHVGRLSLPLWCWLVATTTAVSVPGFYLLRNDTAPTAQANTPNKAAPSSAHSSALPALSKEEFERELARIELLKVYNRTELDWMLLARGSAELSNWEECVGAYRALLSLRRDFRKDSGLLNDLLNASQDAKAFRIVLNLAETVLGRHGVDLLWEMWQKERYLPERKEQAEKVAKKLVIISRRASPALRTAIELTFTTQCDKLVPVLTRAANDADSRSVERLTELARKTGCGVEQQEDCYSCLREGQLVEQALTTAQKTQAPALGSTPED